MLCACCHQRVATQHITTIVDGTTQLRLDLCEECVGLPGGAPEVMAWTGRLAQQPCEFCGAPAVSGGSGPDRPRFWCQQCADVYSHILQNVYAESAKPAEPIALATWAKSAMQEADRRCRAKLSGPR